MVLMGCTRRLSCVCFRCLENQTVFRSSQYTWSSFYFHEKWHSQAKHCYIPTIAEKEIIHFCVTSYNFITSVPAPSSPVTLSELNSHTQMCISETRLLKLMLHVSTVRQSSGMSSQKCIKQRKIIPKEAFPLQISLCNVKLFKHNVTLHNNNNNNNNKNNNNPFIHNIYCRRFQHLHRPLSVFFTFLWIFLWIHSW
jgi:hypothetical protein